MLKKLMLLAMAVGALVAFSASAAQADEWYTHVEGKDVTVGLGRENADEVEFTGELSSIALGGALVNGPCQVHAVVDVWNENFGGTVTGTGDVTDFVITTPCDVTLGGTTLPTEACEIEGASSTDFHWPITVLPETEIEIAGANFTNHYSAGCANFMLPTEGGAEGVATGEFVNGSEESCIVIEEEGEFSEGVLIDGEVCAPGLTLK